MNWKELEGKTIQSVRTRHWFDDPEGQIDGYESLGDDLQFLFTDGSWLVLKADAIDGTPWIKALCAANRTRDNNLMSLYEETGLYDTSEAYESPQAEPELQRPAARPEPSPSDAAKAALQVIAAPASLLSEVLPPDPSQSKIPWGLAVFGACIFAMIWANSLDKK